LCSLSNSLLDQSIVSNISFKHLPQSDQLPDISVVSVLYRKSERNLYSLHCGVSSIQTLYYFREARTAAHNQLRKKVSDWLQKQIAEVGEWRLFEEVSIAQMGFQG